MTPVELLATRMPKSASNKLSCGRTTATTAGRVTVFCRFHLACDYDTRLKNLRRRLGLTQAAVAHRIGAANKAVVYQLESRQRTPSPVFWHVWRH